MNVRNHIHLTGNLGADPKTVTLPSGRMATTLRIATNNYYRDSKGERRTDTTWHTVKAYGKLAELFDSYLVKGSMVSVVGSMNYRKWTDKFEQSRLTAEVIAEEFTFLDGGKRRETTEYVTEENLELMVAADPEPKKTGRRRGKTTARTAKQPTANVGEIIEAVEALEG